MDISEINSKELIGKGNQALTAGKYDEAFGFYLKAAENGDTMP